MNNRWQDNALQPEKALLDEANSGRKLGGVEGLPNDVIPQRCQRRNESGGKLAV
ncbi:MAG TPA: hypothetical protein VK738_17500 [Terriglobales bacterium]|nr:hypothetical protein [Terriglobales bacterium]